MMARMIFVSAIIFVVAIGAGLIRPSPSFIIMQEPDIEALLPDQFGDWKRIALGAAILPAELELGPGEAVAYRAYRDKAGRIVTLVAAYGPPLGDSVRLHRPESCYVAQGFAISERKIDQLKIGARLAPIIRLHTENTTRHEAVSYFLRDGDTYVGHAAGHEILDMKRGLRGASDGALIRVSSSGASETIFDVHSEFLQAFANALSPSARSIFLAERS